MKPRHKRLVILLAFLSSIILGASLLVSVFKDQLVFFYSPTDLQIKTVNTSKDIRVGGLIKEGSVNYNKETLELEFIITDENHDVEIEYKGILPPMFREGQGMVAEGRIENHEGTMVLFAKTLLTKHDENYMPPEVKEGLDKANRYKLQQTLDN